jgi:predicted nucleic acid-binding protein
MTANVVIYASLENTHKDKAGFSTLYQPGENISYIIDNQSIIYYISRLKQVQQYRIRTAYFTFLLNPTIQNAQCAFCIVSEIEKTKYALSFLLIQQDYLLPYHLSYISFDRLFVVIRPCLVLSL